MRKNELTSLLRGYVKNRLSPTKTEQALVTALYAALKDILGYNCLLIGSYARYTASRPLHDLDILFILGKFDESNLHPQVVLNDLHKIIQKDFKNPTSYSIKISQQTHSITISFIESNIEKFSVDIVPAFTSGIKNEFGDDIYWVPEIIKVSKHNRQIRYGELEKIKKNEREWWLKSDPRGYIKAATKINAQNADFRKTAKFIKRWKHNCKKKDGNFKLKSFHIEQVLFRIFQLEPSIDIVDAIFKFFCDIPDIISRPQIKDRADQGKFVDEYISALATDEKNKIIQMRDHFLIKLESISDILNADDLLEAGFHARATNKEGITKEEYLFDYKIPVFIEDEYSFTVMGNVLPREGGFRGKILDVLGLIEIDRQIEFRILGDVPEVDHFKWKVKNDNKSPEPRGEINDHRTLRDPEHSRYDGSHHVECFAIKGGVCVSRAKQKVTLRSFFS